MAQDDNRPAGQDPGDDYQIGRDNIQPHLGPLGLDIHNPVFLISGIGIIAFVLLTLIFQEAASSFFTTLRDLLTSSLGWFFILSGNIFVLFCLFLLLSPLGRIRLGGEDARPEYSYLGWFSMLFAAGMGIGLMFFGVAEPMSHYASSLGGTAVEGGVRTDWAPLGAAVGDPIAARNLGMAATLYHWALHPWAMYAVVALALAFFSFNRGRAAGDGRVHRLPVYHSAVVYVRGYLAGPARRVPEQIVRVGGKALFFASY